MNNVIVFYRVMTPEEHFVKIMMFAINRKLQGEGFYLYFLERLEKWYTPVSIYRAVCEAAAMINSGASPNIACQECYPLIVMRHRRTTST